MAVMQNGKKLTVCLVCNEYPPGRHGGIGTSTQLMARGLVEAGHQVRVIGVYSQSYGGRDHEDDCGVKVWRLRSGLDRRLGWVTGRIKLFRTIAGWSKNREIDMIEVPDWQGWAAGWSKLAVPVVVRLRGSSTYITGELGERVKRSTYYLERASLRRADFCSAVSHYVAQQTRQRFSLLNLPIHVLHNAVKVPDAPDCEVRSNRDVVFTGTLQKLKGIEPLMQAWPAILARVGDARLLLFGKDGRSSDGQSMKQSILNRLDEKTRRSVCFYGHVERERVFQALQQARAAIFPSYVESFAMGPLEAMASGCPTIHTRRCSGPELLDHEQHGLLIDPDNVSQITDSVIRILTDDSLAERLSRAGQQRVRARFAVGDLIPRMEYFYAQCLESFSGRSARSFQASALIDQPTTGPRVHARNVINDSVDHLVKSHGAPP